MKGTTQQQLFKFLTELHDDQQFEVLSASESKEVKTPTLIPSKVSTIDITLLESLNNQKRSIWFTPNSMKSGKRSKAHLLRFNSIVLDIDFDNNKDELASKKEIYLKDIKELQLRPSVIIETKNGYHMYWNLQHGSITDTETYEALQVLMQQKLATDSGSLGAEHLFRLPGFYHWKDPNDPFLCEIILSDYNKRYSHEELVHKYGGKKKLSSLKRKRAAGSFSGKPIELEEFKGSGDISSIQEGCEVFKTIHKKKDPNHDERLAALWTYANLGNEGLDYLRVMARQWNDYDEEITESNIEYGVKKGYKAPTCKWLQEKGICKKRCYQIRNYSKPIDLYYHPWSSLPKRTANRKIVSAPSGFQLSSQVLLDRIVNILEDRGQVVGAGHKSAINEIIRIVESPIYNEKPIVIPAVPGLGKTTFIISYIKYMLEYGTNFGAVLVVERQETIERITEEINSHFDEPKAYAMMGYEKEYCQKDYPIYRPSQCKNCDISFYDCRVKYNYVEQQKYPIVVISQSRLFMMSEKDGLMEALRFWKEFNISFVSTVNFSKMEVKHKRSVLLIDERPKLVENVPTSSETLDTLLADVQTYTPVYYTEVNDAVKMIRNHYSLPDDFKHVNATDVNFQWTTDFTETWNADYKGDYPQYPELIANIIREGGLYHKTDHSITTTHYANLYWQDYSTFIYDGTADLDPDYMDDQFLFAVIPHLRPYSNLTINVCMERNLSKTFYNENSQFVKRFSEDIEEIAKDKKTYVVCYKDFKKQYERELNGIENITIEHYGSTKGTNHLIDNVNIVCTGILNKGESHYLSKAIALNGGVNSFQSKTTDKVRRFEDKDAELIKIYDMVTDLVQEIFRTQLRNHASAEEVNVYICTRDSNIIQLLESTFTGCTINRDWTPKALSGSRDTFREFVDRHSEKYKTKKKLARAFLDQGYTLTTMDIIDVLGVDKTNAAKYLL